MNRVRTINITVTLLRLFAGALFILHGGMKLYGWFGGMPGGATAQFPSQIWFGGMLECYGGMLLVLGLFTQPVAFLLSGTMAVAYWQFHAPKGFWPIQNGGELAALYCFVYLFLAAYGAGPWSVDALLWSRRKAVTDASAEPA